MRLDNERPSANVEDQRGQGEFSNQGGFGSGFGFPGSGRGPSIPIGTGRGGMSISTIVLLVVAYLVFKFIFGIDLIDMMNGSSSQHLSTRTNNEIQIPNTPVDNQSN